MARICLDVISEAGSVCPPRDISNCQHHSALCPDVKRRAHHQMEAEHVLSSSPLWEISFVNADMRTLQSL